MKLNTIQDEVRYMVDKGIAEPSKSQWSLPCVLVCKPDGSYRFCTDFRRVSTVTKTDSAYPQIDNCIE